MFISYGNYGWNIKNNNISDIPDGIYERIVNGKNVYYKRINGIWFIGNVNKLIAEKETRNSIYQVD